MTSQPCASQATMADSRGSTLDDKQLVMKIAAHPILYDASATDHNNPIRRLQIFEAIAAEMGITAASCMTRWRVLRTRFTKIRREKLYGPSGSRIHTKRKWPLYETMKFIEPHIVVRKYMQYPAYVSRWGRFSQQNDEKSSEEEDGPVDTPSSSTVSSPRAIAISNAATKSSSLKLGTSVSQAVPLETVVAVSNSTAINSGFPLSIPTSHAFVNVKMNDGTDAMMIISPNVFTSQANLPRPVSPQAHEKTECRNSVVEEIRSKLKKLEERRDLSTMEERQDCTEMWLMSLKDDFNKLSAESKMLFKVKVAELLYELAQTEDECYTISEVSEVAEVAEVQ